MIALFKVCKAGGQRAAAAAAVATQGAQSTALRFTSTTTTFQGRVSGLDDGSESTLDQDGYYSGGWSTTTSTPSGQGHMAWDNGVSFRGTWKNGKFNGTGSKLYSRGGGYEGEWCEGARSGQGKHLYAGKFGYQHWSGNFVHDQPNGTGTMTHIDGTESSYAFEMGKPVTTAESEENFFSGKVSGVGDSSPSTHGVDGVYKGGWVDGFPEGFGEMTWDNGIVYKGMWANKLPNGQGRKLYSRGGGYEGSWLEGKRNGMGITFFDSATHLGKSMGLLRWEGPFVNDVAHGTGQSYVAAQMKDGDARWVGDTAVKGETLEFHKGEIVES